MITFFRTVSYLLAGSVIATASFAADADLKATLSGKTIVSEENNAEFKLRRNGRLTGKAGTNQQVEFSGAWTIRDGRFCRTIQKPESWAGTECQAIELGQGTVTINGRNGPIQYVIK